MRTHNATPTAWVLLAVAALLVAAPAVADWSLYDVDARTAGGPSLRLDAAGNPLIAYGGSALRLARWDGSTFQVEEVVRTPCGVGVPSLILDGAGLPVIAYQIVDTGGLEVARWDGSRWLIDAVDTSGELLLPSLTLDSAGNPAVAWHDGVVKVATFNGSAYDVETVESTDAVSYWISLALDASDQPTIAYHDGASRSLKLARRSGPTWAIETVDTDAGRFCSLALDGRGYPVISYHFDLGEDLKLARWNGTGWDLEVVDAAGIAGYNTSLSVDAAGHPVIGYSDWRPAHLKLARFDGSAWSLTTIDPTAGAGHGISLALDRSGQPVVAYGLDDGDLAMARAAGTGWDLVPVTAGGAPGYWPSLAFDDSNRAWISEHDRLQGQLRVAQETGATWTLDDLDAGGTGSALALDSRGNPVVSYRDTAADLKVARWTGAAWDIAVADRPMGDELTSAVALDGLDRPVVAYGERFGRGLRVARFDGAAWAVTPIDDQGLYPSLAVDGAGMPAVSYYTQSDLMLARFDGTGWTRERVDDGSNFGWSSLTFDRRGFPVISYGDDARQQVKLARWNGAVWQLEVVESLGTAYGATTSVKLDVRGEPAVAYTDPGTLLLKYARRNGAAWDIDIIDSSWDVFESSPALSLAFERDFEPAIAYLPVCQPVLRLARHDRQAAVLYRGVVNDLSLDWKPLALPLDETRDDPAPPFPVAGYLNDRVSDSLGTAAPLVLYRALRDGTSDAGNVLRVVKDAGLATIQF